MPRLVAHHSDVCISSAPTRRKVDGDTQFRNLSIFLKLHKRFSWCILPLHLPAFFYWKKPLPLPETPPHFVMNAQIVKLKSIEYAVPQ